MTKQNQKKCEFLELLAETVHKSYCEDYQQKNGKTHWTNGDYSLLEEATKDTNRKIIIAVLNFSPATLNTN